MLLLLLGVAAGESALDTREMEFRYIPAVAGCSSGRSGELMHERGLCYESCKTGCWAGSVTLGCTVHVYRNLNIRCMVYVNICILCR